MLTVKGMHDAELNLNSRSAKKNLYSMFYVQIIVFATSNIICWVTAGAICITCMFLEKYSIELVIWVVAAVSPINSLMNPVMFINMVFRE